MANCESAARRWVARWVFALCAMTMLGGHAYAQRIDSTVAIGNSVRIWSQALGEERRLLIYLPPHYAVSAKPYPVVYLLDAEGLFHQATGILQFLGSYNGRIPEMIVVGVTNTNRGRDLTPPLTDPEEKKKITGTYDFGGAGNFLKFMADELAPWVDAHYRTVPYRILVGHSFGGLFNSYALITRPEVYQAHIAVSPSLWWDKQGALTRAEAGIRKLQRPGWMFVSWGDNEPSIKDSTSKLVASLAANPVPGFTLEHRYYPGDDHMSTPHRTLYDALERLFADWNMKLYENGEPKDVTLEQVEAHYAALSKRFGFTIAPEPEALNAVAQTLLRKKDSTQALAMLRRCVREYPYLAAAHMQLGEALEKMDRKQEALMAYQAAVEASVNDEMTYGDPIGEYRKKVRELAGK